VSQPSIFAPLEVWRLYTLLDVEVQAWPSDRCWGSAKTNTEFQRSCGSRV